MDGTGELIALVESYQDGRYGDGAADRVAAWLERFPVGSRDMVANELAYVLARAFLTQQDAVDSVQRWLRDPAQLSQNIVSNWRDATFLSIQRGGGSQDDLLRIMCNEAAALDMPCPSDCNGQRLFVYVDDVSVHGMRLLNDFTPWFRERAPGRAELLILLQRQLRDRHGYLTRELTNRARSFGKELRVHWACDAEFAESDCYQPMVLPDDPLVAEYVARNGGRAQLRRVHGVGQYFSSTAARGALEGELLLAGVRVLAENPWLSGNRHMRPLGNSVWRGLGLGVPLVTWRNCPNSAPLCLWADGDCPPLFPRLTNRREA